MSHVEQTWWHPVVRSQPSPADHRPTSTAVYAEQPGLFVRQHECNKNLTNTGAWPLYFHDPLGSAHGRLTLMAAQGLELAPVTRQYEADLTPVKSGDPPESRFKFWLFYLIAVEFWVGHFWPQCPFLKVTSFLCTSLRWSPGASSLRVRRSPALSLAASSSLPESRTPAPCDFVCL